MGTSKPKVIIDTDAGHDDVLAMMLLIKSGLVDVLAVTAVAGNSTIENVTRNATYVLDLLQRRDIPVYSGHSQPLQRQLVQAVVHGDSGLDGVDTSSTIYKLTGDADRQLIRLVRAHPHEISLLTIGPLSNVARAFIQEPELPTLLERAVIMGGTVDACGNKNRVAEFNIFVDPEAADIVFRASVPKVLIPLDVCNDMPLFLTDFERLKGTALYGPLINMMKQFIIGIERHEGTKGALVYDAVAGYYLLNPGAFHIKPMDIVIETKGEHTSGMTVVEKRRNAPRNNNVDVVVSLDRNQFINDLIQILGA